MRMLKFVGNKIWAIDPGYLHLKQGIKTILAIALSLWFMRHQAPITQVMASIACGFSMQGVVAHTVYQRLRHIVLFDAVFFSVFILGLMVRDSTLWSGLVLALLGFVVNYIRRFGLERSMAPMMVWMLCFLSILLPMTNNQTIWQPIYGMVIGFGCSAFMLLIWPDNYARLFVENANRFLQTFAAGLEAMRRALIIHSSTEGALSFPFEKTQATLRRLMESNVVLHHKLEAFSQARRHHILIEYYALMNAFSLLNDAMQRLLLEPQVASRSLVLLLARSYKQYAREFLALRVGLDYAFIGTQKRNFLTYSSQDKWQVNRPSAPVIIMMLNFKLGFNLLRQHTWECLRYEDAA